jgi:hypothetical protein
MSYQLEQGIDVPKDPYSHTIPTLSVEHTEIHAGRMFELDGTLTVTNAQIGSVAITVPAQAAAVAVVDMTNALADLTYTARAKGRAGNDISVTHVDPSGNNQPLTVSVSGKDITVSLATGAGGAITSTGLTVAAAVVANVAANDLVTVAVEGAGTGVVNAKAKQNLINGKDIVDAHLKAVSLSVTGGPFTVILKEDSTFVAAGTAVTPRNRNRQSANTSQLACKVNANTTVADGAGKVDLATTVLGAATPGPTVVAGSKTDDEEWLLSRGAKNYLLQFTNGSAGALVANYQVQWYERVSN